MKSYIYHSHGDKDGAMDLKYVLYINLSAGYIEFFLIINAFHCKKKGVSNSEREEILGCLLH